MERNNFSYLMARLAVAFKEEVSEERISLYYEFLGMEDPEKLSRVVNEIIQSKNWFPKIAEIKELLNPPITYNSSYWPDFKEIEYIGEKASPERERELLKNLWDAIKEKEPEIKKPLSPKLEGEEAIEFERKRKIAKEKAKKLR